MDDLVSIVIPVYNSEKYLEECIKSCLNQTYSNTEIIAVNDGSIDTSENILNSYLDSIRVINQENQGPSAALNAGIKASKGMWIKILDADDILFPECVEFLIKEVEKINNKKVIIYGHVEVFDKNGKIRDRKKEDFTKKNQLEQNVILLSYNPIPHVGTILHKDIFFQYGMYNESIKAAIDYELWLRLCLLHNFKIHFMDKKIAKYRMHEENLTTQALRETPNYAEDVRKSILNKLNLKSQQEYNLALKQYKKNLKPSIRTKLKRKIIHLKNKTFLSYSKNG